MKLSHSNTILASCKRALRLRRPRRVSAELRAPPLSADIRLSPRPPRRYALELMDAWSGVCRNATSVPYFSPKSQNVILVCTEQVSVPSVNAVYRRTGGEKFDEPTV